MDEYKTKKQKVIEWYTAGDVSKAYKECKNWKNAFTKDQLRILSIAYEVLGSNRKDDFYKSLGINTTNMITEAKSIFENKYLVTA